MADLKSLTNIRTTEDLINAVSALYFNLNEIERTYYDMFINPIPMDVKLQRYSDTGVLENITVPNRAKDRQGSIIGNGAPEGSVAATVGVHYLDLTTGNLYYKASGTDSYGWVSIWSSLSLVEGLNYLAPDGDGSKLNGLNAYNVTSGVLSVTRGGTGSTTISGLVKGNGISPMSEAEDGKDYLGPASMTGVICYYPTNNIPNGWLLCDGSSYLRSEYPDLFNSLKVISPDGVSFSLPYGYEDDDHFNVPNLMRTTTNNRSCYVRCWDGNSEFNKIQDDEVGSHVHSFEGITESESAHTHDRGTMNITGSLDGGLLDCTERPTDSALEFDENTLSQLGKGSVGANSYKIKFDASKTWTGVSGAGSAHTHDFSGETKEDEEYKENNVLSIMLVPIIKY